MKRQSSYKTRTIEEYVEPIKRLMAGELLRKVSRETGIPAGTLSSKRSGVESYLGLRKDKSKNVNERNVVALAKLIQKETSPDGLVPQRETTTNDSNPISNFLQAEKMQEEVKELLMRGVDLLLSKYDQMEKENAELKEQLKKLSEERNEEKLKSSWSNFAEKFGFRNEAFKVRN